MRHEIIKTDSYLLVLDYKDVQPGDSFLLNFDHPSGRIRRCHRVCDDGKEDLLMIDPVGFGFSYRRDCKRISAHAPLNGAPYLDGVDRLPPTWRDNGEKRKYKEEDIRKAFCDGQYDGMMGVMNNCPVSNVDTYIQSLQQPKLSIWFECETERVENNDVVFEDGSFNKPPYRYVPKTIINSEGRKEWVGKYIYE